MRFVQGDEGWRLLDERPGSKPTVLAILRDELEVVVVRHFCERYLADGLNDDPSSVEYQGKRYSVRTVADHGRLTLIIEGENGPSRRIETQFGFPAKE